MKMRDFSLRIAAVLLIIISFSLPAFASEDDTPISSLKNIFDIVEKSGRFDTHLTYFDPGKELSDYKALLKNNNPDQVLTTEKGEKVVSVYKPSPETAGIVAEALKLEMAGKSGQAEEALKKAILGEPQFSMPYVYMGQIYMKRGNFSEALLWLDRAVEKNPVNYTAYKMRAKCYLELNQPDKQKENLILAIIFNRNDAEAWETLSNMGRRQGFKVYNDAFIPLYSIEKMNNGKIRIYVDKDTAMRWVPYAYSKAVWQYEPGYFEGKTGEITYDYTTDEELDCVSNMIDAYRVFRERGKIRKDPMLERMIRIEDRFFLREFVLFDVIAPLYPDILVTMDDKYIMDMIDYVNEFVLVKVPQ